MMKIKFLLLLLPFLCIACNRSSEEKSESSIEEKPKAEMTFDKSKWLIQEGTNYPYREKMLNDVVYNDTIRSLNKGEILELLGEPNKINDGHLYYTITRTRFELLTLHTKTMVIKLREDDGIEWIKIHK